MTPAYAQGQLRIALMGDLLRNPGTKQVDLRKRLEIEDEAVVRITLKRLEDAGFVGRVGDGFVLRRAGIDELATIRSWVTV